MDQYEGIDPAVVARMAIPTATTLEMTETCGTVLLFVNTRRQNHEQTVKPCRRILMKASTRLTDAAANELPRELVELGRAIAALPENQFRDLEPAYVRVVECVRRRRRILELVQEALAQLRLDIKYLMFDLDLTRKERDEFKAQLDELTQDDFGAN